MGDILATSISGLLAFQQALDVTSNNVSNSTTKGYSVENINLAEAAGSGSAGSYVGDGVDVASVTRSYDETLAAQVRSSNASYQAFNTLSTQASTVDNMLSGSSTGITVTLQNFVNALQSLSTAPTSTSNRQVLISQAQAVVTQLQSYQSQLDTQSTNLEQQISTSVNQINSLAQNIASVNAEITAAGTTAGSQPLTLEDQRDSLIDQLSQYVNLNAVTESNGQMDVYIGTGQALVTGGTANLLTATPNPNNASEYNIGLTASTGGTPSDVTAEINGGSLGGLLTTRSQVIDPTENALGQIAVGLATVMNQQQASGIDQTGAPGSPMFAIGGVEVQPSTNNAGTATITATRTNLSALTTDDYSLNYSGGTWQLQDTTTGQPVAMSGSGTAAAPFQAAGMSFVVGGGAPADGDNYVIRPTAGAIDGMAVLTTNPSQIAAASLGTSMADSTNTGSGSISTPTVTDPTNWTSDNFTVSFTSATQYQVIDTTTGAAVTSGTYTAGSPISFNGEQVTISGTPASGDNFTVSAATAADIGDNTNVLAMANVLSSNTLDGNTASLNGAANNLVSAVGVLTQQAQANASAQQTVNQSATDARNNLSGVNLDEEAAKMLQFQQAYQACAQMITTSNTIFNSLISAITNG
jgi:flagellar hook-associated protein 1 FlgK